MGAGDVQVAHLAMEFHRNDVRRKLAAMLAEEAPKSAHEIHPNPIGFSLAQSELRFSVFHGSAIAEPE